MFDPNLPATDSDMVSAEMRSQFNGLKALIDALLTVTAAQVDGVTTLDPGNPATAAVSVVGNMLHFTFAIPRGNEGAQGAQGAPGNPGNDGAQGPQGPAFAQAIVDAVNTLPSGSAATVSVSYDGTNVHFTFGIPQGSDGAAGLPGEVSQTDLNNGLLNTLNQTSNNTNAVATLNTPFGDPDMDAMRQKMNELILNGRR
jgi:hypothetical protein